MSQEQARTPKPLDTAREKSGEVQRTLEVASAELGLTHGALDRNLPPETKTGDVAWAIEQNRVLERKVRAAAEELEEVNELLDRARAEAAGA